MPRYSIVSGYHDQPNNFKGVDTIPFFRTWLKNTQCAFPDAVETFIIDTNPSRIPLEHDQVQWISMEFNPGHVNHLDAGVISDFLPRYCGWTLCFITGAMLAYYNNSDLLFKEQDCLVFGKDISQAMYSALGSKQIVVGSVEDTGCGVGYEQSLVLVRRDFIPVFVARLLVYDFNDSGPGSMRPEQKWFRLLQPEEVSTFPFGYGRRRPAVFPPEDPVWYIQQVSPQELNILLERKQIA